MAEYRRGQGPDALPQGGATQANAATPSAAAFDSPGPLVEGPGSEIPVVFDTEVEDPEDDRALSENMQVLVDSPDPNYRPRLIAPGRQGRLPTSVVRRIAVLQAAVQDPTAPPALRAYYNAVIRQLELERARGGR